ncbi:flagellar hook-associated protein FlgK [Donghicola sp. C2-DW-16]|uniref:Flagellar hook-associated protein 1 n=1 Tax=Donghicola mangrovi TaxID=2729614 RepID=A0ABX2PAL3_9RHOB|nr:flagellar hook-associated protein FlgK [Donghicola mangrovi]NVO25986.1 flagellar hook-associated protein FlgK [Donghicola mangrovi]
MSLTSAISNALSGLGASSLAAEIVSSNLSNATNETYAKREITQVSNINGGVKVTGILRQRDAALQSSVNSQAANFAAANTRTLAFAGVDAAVGTVGEDGSLTSTLDSLQSALISASAAPESDLRLQQVLYAAGDLATGINNVEEAIQAERLSADQSIATDIDVANEALSQIEKLNKQIVTLSANGRSTATLLDRRDAAVATLSEIIPVRVLERDSGAIALVSRGGQVLLDGKAVTLEFTAAQGMDAEMSLASGALSGISIAGKDGSDISDRLVGGRLEAAFEVRDSLMPTAGEELDALRQQLLSDTAYDGAGLFTETNGKLSVNSQLDAEPWRLRDGFAAVSQGYAGNTGYLDTLTQGLSDLSGVFGDYVTGQSGQLLRAEMSQSAASASYAAMSEAVAAGGVDSDAELQTLLMIEKIYTANARVISVVDEMMDTLMRMT